MLNRVCVERGSVTAGWISLDVADLAFIESVHRKNLREGEERLMLAVLESAVEDFQKYVLARKPRGKQLFQHAEDWFLEKDSEEILSFENICETLQFQPDYIRQGLIVWKEAKFKALSVDGHQDRTKLHSTRIRHHPVRLSKTA